MAWEWSHTADAYGNARAQLDALRKAELTIVREWAHYDREQSTRYRRPSWRASFRLPAGVRRLPQDVLADLVWDRMEELRTYTSGGWNAYACPYGCHTVPFEPVADREA